MIRRCVKSGLVDGKELAADRTYLPANVSKDSWMDTEVEAELSMQSYLDRLDEELSKQPGFKRPPAKTIRKRRTTSKTDPDSGCINHGKKSGIGYLMETTVDCKYGIITGVECIRKKKKVCWFYGIWSGKFKTGSRCKTLHWIVATIPAPFIAVWNCWALQDIFLPFRFPILRKSMAFTIYPKKMHFVVRRAQNLFTNG